MVNTVLSTAFFGLQDAVQRVDKVARNIAGTDSPDKSGIGGAVMPQDIVDLKLGETAYKANLAVIETANGMQDALLKTFDKKV